MIASCGGLSLSPVGNYPLQAVWRACGAFLWLYRVPVSTIMLMGGGANYMPFILMHNIPNIGFSCLTICCTNTLSSFQNDSFGSV